MEVLATAKWVVMAPALVEPGSERGAEDVRAFPVQTDGGVSPERIGSAER
jgi:hypothetical protein